MRSQIVNTLLFRFPFLLIGVAFFCCLNTARTQESDFKIVGHELDNNLCLVKLKVKAVRQGVGVSLKKEELVFRETIEGFGNKANIDSIAYTMVENVDKNRKREILNILFLVGTDAKARLSMGQSRSLIQRIVTELTGADSCRFFLSAYGDKITKPQQIAGLQGIEAVLNEYESHTDSAATLFRGIIDCLRFSREQKGNWAIFILTDGSNLEIVPEHPSEAPYTQSDVLYFLSRTSLNTAVFPIALGAAHSDSLLLEIPRATPSKIDTFSINTMPLGLRDKIGRRMDIAYNNIIYLFTNNTIFRGETRQYNAKWIGGPRMSNEATYNFNDIGTKSNPQPLCGDETWEALLYKWLLGLLMVSGTLGAFAYAIPFAEKRNFRQKFVRPYHREPNIVRTDPLTGEAIQEGELVVYKCNQKLCTLATWEYVGNKCPSYPRCLDFATPCNGAGAPGDSDKFFSGKGLFRRLNWLWFGMAGGLIAWTLFALFKWLGLEWYNSLLYPLYKSFSGGAQTTQGVNALADDTLFGAAFGAGICFTLSWVEERSQPRKISWWRIALRTVLGLLLSMLIFFLGFYAQYKGYIGQPTVSALLTWIVFGLGVGAVLSTESTIPLSRGLLGGLAASLLAFGVYLLFGQDFTLGKLFSFLFMGAVLGFTLVTVITRLEDFELEYVSPEMFRQINPISKWLKKDIEVFIGREPGSYVYVKWEDPVVESFHARLFYNKGIVYIEPLAETLVNGKMLPLKNSTPLRNGDLIQLGRDSITRMRYRERRAAGQTT